MFRMNTVALLVATKIHEDLSKETVNHLKRANAIEENRMRRRGIVPPSILRQVDSKVESGVALGAPVEKEKQDHCCCP